jgi:hypothetical protein
MFEETLGGMEHISSPLAAAKILIFPGSSGITSLKR